jgi:hypothetical protein
MKKTVIILLVLTFAMFASGQDLFKFELDLPAKGLSQRATRKISLSPGERIILFNEEGPGCIFHWWLTYAPRPEQKSEGQLLDIPHYLRVRIFYDDNSEPDVNISLAQFYSILQGKDLYTVNNAAIKILPRNALNSFFPIPFQSCRIELVNESDLNPAIWSMFDWQEYPGMEITTYRFNVIDNAMFPADSAGSMLMADITGEGFIAGLTKSVVVKDASDAWFHSGGDMVLIDGETVPRAIRGIGGEDMFNMSFGVHDIQNDWVGAPVRNREPYERVMYRVYGPSPIWFFSSAVFRFGTKANNIESIIYAYVKEVKQEPVTTPQTWELCGPFSCLDDEQFNRKEWPEAPREDWPEYQTGDFDPYIMKYRNTPERATIFKMPVVRKSEHCWCDFASAFRGRQPTNMGAQPGEVSAYAIGNIGFPGEGKYQLHLGYDDWIKVWINEQLVHVGRHDNGFQNESIEVDIPSEDVEIRVKLSNFDNFQWRLWAFALRFDSLESK